MRALQLRTVSRIALAASAVACAPVAISGPAIKVTLLGTGCPPAVMNRFGPSTLVGRADRYSSWTPVRARCRVSTRSK